ncbi:hypothetical protein EDC94DRAFT_585981 [Helicostylum pulchrum]|nr:hypothetical protein EDC94DRAFT_585981 [Helicostylum pulchrum]
MTLGDDQSLKTCTVLGPSLIFRHNKVSKRGKDLSDFTRGRGRVLKPYNDIKRFRRPGRDHGKEFIFREDGASCHTGRYARWWKKGRLESKALSTGLLKVLILIRSKMRGANNSNSYECQTNSSKVFTAMKKNDLESIEEVVKSLKVTEEMKRTTNQKCIKDFFLVCLWIYRTPDLSKYGTDLVKIHYGVLSTFNTLDKKLYYSVVPAEKLAPSNYPPGTAFFDRRCAARQLSTLKRVTIMNVLILSKIWYSLRLLQSTERFFQRLRSSIYQFIWQKKHPALKKKVIFLPWTYGGLKVLDPVIQHTILQKRWLKYIFDSSLHSSFVCLFVLNHLLLFSKSAHCLSVPFYFPEYRKSRICDTNLSIWHAIFRAFDIIQNNESVSLPELPLATLLDLPLYKAIMLPDDNH